MKEKRRINNMVLFLVITFSVLLITTGLMAINLANKQTTRSLAEFLITIALTFGLLTAVIAISASDAEGKTVDWSKEKVIDIVGEVNNNILDKAVQLEKEAGKPVIRILINSPGGSVLHGNIFVQAMKVAKSRGSRIECVVTNLAASMGFVILANCDTRYTLQGGLLLFHEARVSVGNPISPSELQAVLDQFKYFMPRVDEVLRRELGVSKTEYDKHNIAQTLWEAGVFIKKFPKFGIILIDDIKLPEDVRRKAFNPIGESNPFMEFPVEIML
jgi:ATP-dependent protease ClpP protease subunit